MLVTSETFTVVSTKDNNQLKIIVCFFIEFLTKSEYIIALFEQNIHFLSNVIFTDELSLRTETSSVITMNNSVSLKIYTNIRNVSHKHISV